MPLDALWHAEANALLRAAEPYGGSLLGGSVSVVVDRQLCRSCDEVLPYMGLQLGNPTVRFHDPFGRVKTMKDGRWLD
jgi:hypothetical protein